MRILRFSDNKIMPWKNGLGITREIDISPNNADFSKNAFDFRLSSATVSSSSEFSKFPSYDRILCVIEGAGIKINDDQYSRLQPFQFKGETPITGMPLESKIVDLGIIFKRDKFTAQMMVTNKSQTLDLIEGVHYVMAIAGSIKINDSHLNAGDTAKIEMRGPAKLEITAPAHAILISLKTI